jgi:hypothetical protein
MRSHHASTAALPKDFTPEPLGPPDHVRKRLRDVLPGIDFADPSWGVLDGPGWSIEFSVGRTETVDSVMLHVRGSDDSISAVRAAGEALDAKALDFSTGEFLKFDEDPAAGLRAWRAFRDRATKK